MNDQVKLYLQVENLVDDTWVAEVWRWKGHLIWIMAEALIDLYLFPSAAPIRVHHSAIICMEALIYNR